MAPKSLKAGKVTGLDLISPDEKASFEVSLALELQLGPAACFCTLQEQTPCLNPKKLLQSLQRQMEVMQQHTEVLVKLRGMREALILVVAESKKLKQAIKKAEDLKETRAKQQCMVVHSHPSTNPKPIIHPPSRHLYP